MAAATPASPRAHSRRRRPIAPVSPHSDLGVRRHLAMTCSTSAPVSVSMTNVLHSHVRR